MHLDIINPKPKRKTILKVINVVLPTVLCLMLNQCETIGSYLILVRESARHRLAKSEDSLGNELTDLASNPAVLHVNFRHLTSSPSSDMMVDKNRDGLTGLGGEPLDGQVTSRRALPNSRLYGKGQTFATGPVPDRNSRCWQIDEERKRKSFLSHQPFPFPAKKESQLFSKS